MYKVRYIYIHDHEHVNIHNIILTEIDDPPPTFVDFFLQLIYVVTSVWCVSDH